jgi:hypothetical protein
MIRIAATIIVVYRTSPIAGVAAQEIWTCTYPGLSQGRRPVIVRYRQEDEFLMEDKWKERYQILQNNQFGLIAIWSISEIEGGNAEPSIGARTLVINKSSGEFLFSGGA